MRGFRERLQRRVFGARAAVFFLWVILVFALTILVLSIQNERSSNSNSSSSSIRLQRRERVLISRALFHAPSSSSALSASHADQVIVGTNRENADAADTLYGDDKRIIHTGPNPLHN